MPNPYGDIWCKKCFRMSSKCDCKIPTEEEEVLLSKPTISVIIPHMPMPEQGGFPSTEKALQLCVQSIKGQYDELIVVVNDGIGFGPAVNRGLTLATGDFLFVIGNDTVLAQGTLRDLCDSDTVMAPMINGPDPSMAPRAFYAMPRWVYEKAGGYDERYEVGFWEDDDLMMRWKEAGISWGVHADVIVQHWQDGGLTMKQLDEHGSFERNRALFNDKWKTSR